jgi:hypothetical protein
MTPTNRILSFGAIGALAVAAYAIQTSHQLTVDGTVVSNSVVFENGRYMVPVRDIAKYFGYKEDRNGGNPILTRTGAAQSLLGGGTTVPGATPTTAAPSAVPVPPATQVPVPASEIPPLATTSGPLNPATPTWSSLTPMIPSPGSPVTAATANLFPSAPAAPTAYTATVGQSTAINDFSYSVDSIQDVGNKYKLAYDQRGTTLHPTFKTDSLVVVNMTVTNTGSQPISPVVPGMADFTVFDSSKVGYPAGYVDIRQSTDLVNGGGDSTYDIAPSVGGSDVVLAPGGKVRFAVIASIPAGKRVGMVTIHLTGEGMNGTSHVADSIITINQ